jgi:hypothetical protein
MLPLLLLQAVYVVDDTPGPGVNFPDIPPAIAAAADGDILVVQPGTYSHFTLSGKGLRIVGSGSAATVVTNIGSTGFESTIANVPSTSIAYVDRMRFTTALGPFLTTGPRLTVSGATTRAVLADLVLDGASCVTPYVPTVNAALYVLGATVHVTRSQINGGSGCHGFAGVTIPAGSGIVVDGGGRAHVSSSVLLGGAGAGGAFAPGGPGATAVEVLAGSQVSLGDCQITGGNGGTSISSSSGTPSPAISVDAAFVRISGGPTAFVKGGTFPGLTFCVPPSPVLPPAIVTSAGGSAMVHSVPLFHGSGTGCPPIPQTTGAGITFGAPALPLLEVGGSLTLSGSAVLDVSNGPPGAPFLLVIAASPAYLSLGAGAIGEMLIDPFVFGTIASGSLGPNGDFSLTLPLGGFSPGIVYLPVYLQAGAFDAGTLAWLLSNATVAAVRP